jgi:hypothetical protein
MQNVAQFLGCGITGGEALSVNLAQRADEGVAVLVAYVAIVLAVTAGVTPWFGAPLNLLAVALIAGIALLAGGVVAVLRNRRRG